MQNTLPQFPYLIHPKLHPTGATNLHTGMWQGMTGMMSSQSAINAWIMITKSEAQAANMMQQIFHAVFYMHNASYRLWSKKVGKACPRRLSAIVDDGRRNVFLFSVASAGRPKPSPPTTVRRLSPQLSTRGISGGRTVGQLPCQQGPHTSQEQKERTPPTPQLVPGVRTKAVCGARCSARQSFCDLARAAARARFFSSISDAFEGVDTEVLAGRTTPPAPKFWAGRTKLIK